MNIRQRYMELDQVANFNTFFCDANFNTVVLSHCACSNIEIPVTVIRPSSTDLGHKMNGLFMLVKDMMLELT